MERTNFKIRKLLINQKASKLQQYQALVIGRSGLLTLIQHELITLVCSWIPGALGLLLRSKLYPFMLGHVGKNVVFGTNVVLRHPHKIFIGDNVVIDDNCLLDAKGGDNAGIFLGNQVFIGRNSILSCKDGRIYLNDGVNIGFNVEIFSSGRVTVGEGTLIAAYCYLVGGGNYAVDRIDIPFAEQNDMLAVGRIEIGNNVWIAAHVTILDGVTVGADTVIGAGAVVDTSLPALCVATGVPAQVRRRRGADNGATRVATAEEGQQPDRQ